jgi:hypothetical protein
MNPEIEHPTHPAEWCQNPVYTVQTCNGLCHRPYNQTLPNGLRLCWQHARLRVV